MFNQSGTRRWTHFNSALRLAVQRSAHKWTFEDFAECFPLYVEEDKNGASATFNSISEYIEAQDTRDLEKLFEDYKVRENVDTLHTMINDAKDRKSRGMERKDAWKEDLEPRVAVAARTVPILEHEAKQLRKALQEVHKENEELQRQLTQVEQATAEADATINEILDDVETVYDMWLKLPMEDLEAWTVQALGTLKPTLPP